MNHQKLYKDFIYNALDRATIMRSDVRVANQALKSREKRFQISRAHETFVIH